jgi:hypothetical protein
MGKTTFLAQWAGRDGQAFAWVSVDEADNDPKVLLTYAAEALDAVEPVGERVFDALASPGSSVLGSVVPRLGSAFSSMTKPVVLVIDDVHLLRNFECRAALSVARKRRRNPTGPPPKRTGDDPWLFLQAGPDTRRRYLRLRGCPAGDGRQRPIAESTGDLLTSPSAIGLAISLMPPGPQPRDINDVRNAWLPA